MSAAKIVDNDIHVHAAQGVPPGPLASYSEPGGTTPIVSAAQSRETQEHHSPTTHRSERLRSQLVG